MPSFAKNTKTTLIPVLRYRDAPAATEIRDEDYRAEISVAATSKGIFGASAAMTPGERGSAACQTSGR